MSSIYQVYTRYIPGIYQVYTGHEESLIKSKNTGEPSSLVIVTG